MKKNVPKYINRLEPVGETDYGYVKKNIIELMIDGIDLRGEIKQKIKWLSNKTEEGKRTSFKRTINILLKNENITPLDGAYKTKGSNKTRYRFTKKGFDGIKNELSKEQFWKFIINFPNPNNEIISDYEKIVLNLEREFSPLAIHDSLKKFLNLKKKDSFVLKGKFEQIIDVLGHNGSLDLDKIVNMTTKLTTNREKTNHVTYIHALVEYGILTNKLTKTKKQSSRFNIMYELSPLGVMLFIKQSNKNQQKINSLIKNYEKQIPLIFENSIWRKLKKHNVYDVLDSLANTYFDNTPLISKLNGKKHLYAIVNAQELLRLNYFEKLKDMYYTGINVLDTHLHKITSTPMRVYGTKEHSIQDTTLATQALWKAEEIIVKNNNDYNDSDIITKTIRINLDFCRQLISIRNSYDPLYRDQQRDSTKPRFYDPDVEQTMTNTISFHFYILLQAQNSHQAWIDLLKDEKLSKWYDRYLTAIKSCMDEDANLIKSQIKIPKENTIKHAEC